MPTEKYGACIESELRDEIERLSAANERIKQDSPEAHQWLIEVNATIDRLSAENSRLQEIMRHCIDCQLAMDRASTQPGQCSPELGKVLSEALDQSQQGNCLYSDEPCHCRDENGLPVKMCPNFARERAVNE
jgi:hypothetical protein